MQIKSAEFVKSAPSWKECPEQFLPEFAFIGRSNVGKSSLINMIVRKNGLAKSSKIPWKTKLINFFMVNDEMFFVDLPGYGYAKSSVADRKKWINNTQDYFFNRPCLLHVFVLVDGSIPPQDIDIDFCKTLHESSIPFSVVVTKIDKCNQSELHKNRESFCKILKSEIVQLPQMFISSTKKAMGGDKILNYIDELISRYNGG